MPDAPFAGAASLSFQYGEFVNRANGRRGVAASHWQWHSQLDTVVPNSNPEDWLGNETVRIRVCSSANYNIVHLLTATVVGTRVSRHRRLSAGNHSPTMGAHSADLHHGSIHDLSDHQAIR